VSAERRKSRLPDDFSGRDLHGLQRGHRLRHLPGHVLRKEHGRWQRASVAEPGDGHGVRTLRSGYELPEGQGVCLYTTPPQSTIPHFNDDSWFDAASQTTKNCGGTPPNYLVLPDGTPCGGYLTELKDGSSGYPEALGYTCQTATYEDSTNSPQTAHLCMPPTGSGLGKCVADTFGNAPLYDAVGGVANPSWLAAGKTAGGGTLPPLALTARRGSRPGKATFETPAGARPRVKVEIEVDRDHPDQMAFDLTVQHVALAAPVRCSGKKGSQTQLETSCVLKTGSRPDMLVGTFLPWECHGQDLRR
jgi:hypothetical protein